MARVKRIEKIMVRREFVGRLMSDFGCTQATVYRALRGESYSDKAIKLREVAVDKYQGIKVRVPYIVP